MGAPQQLMYSYAAAASSPAIEDYFSAYTFDATGGTQTITNGIDLGTKGGLVWCKNRTTARDHKLSDTVRGTTFGLITDTTAAQTTDSQGLTAFSSSGFTVGTDLNYCGSNTEKVVTWSFAQGPKFFKVAQVVVSGSDQTVDLSSLGTVGMVTVKRTDSTSNWYTWHKDLSAGNLVYLNTTAAQASLGYITVSGTTLTLVQSVIGNGTYIVYAWAHDSSAGGMIQCGSVATDGGGNATVSLGWEPQYVLVKAISTTGQWRTMDESRGFTVSNAQILEADSSGSEYADAEFSVTATGFKMNGYLTSSTVSYLAIRRGPMKPPTVGTQVYNAIARTGTGAAEKITGVGFPPDLSIIKKRSSTTLTGATWEDRLRGATQTLLSTATIGETAQAQATTSFNMDGTSVGTFTNENASTHTYINWYLRRYPKVFDEVCYTATGANMTVTHNLTVAPEMMIIKERTSPGNWAVYYGDNTSYMVLNTTAIPVTISTAWNNTSPTSSVFSLGTLAAVNDSFSGSYVAYLFATLAGISKVGSYTGNGSSQTINCGFTTGARFIMIKRTDAGGDWFVWDTTRGIVAGNDGHLSLNTTAAEIITDDSIDPDNSGFIVNQLAATNVNVTSASYIFCSFA